MSFVWTSLNEYSRLKVSSTTLVSVANVCQARIDKSSDALGEVRLIERFKWLWEVTISFLRWYSLPSLRPILILVCWVLSRQALIHVNPSLDVLGTLTSSPYNSWTFYERKLQNWSARDVIFNNYRKSIIPDSFVWVYSSLSGKNQSDRILMIEYYPWPTVLVWSAAPDILSSREMIKKGRRRSNFFTRLDARERGEERLAPSRTDWKLSRESP